ncbi:MAG TPA: DUF47 family protein [Gemmatimonadales bacterium]|nr:DUF47 family protein [Gemmatimonadales bacterium]
MRFADEQFFELLCGMADRTKEAALHLATLFSVVPQERLAEIAAIERLEHEADQITHELANRLGRAKTRLDRAAIHAFASKLDDVMDAIDSIARRTRIFRLGPASEEVRRLVEVIPRMTDTVAEAFGRLKSRQELTLYVVEAKRFEAEGDAIYDDGLSKLFEAERDPVELFKWKEIYDELERTLDLALEVAIALESLSATGL